jgi:hypothetical protein
MTIKKLIYPLFWAVYCVAMWQLYLVMEAKIPEYIRTEVMRGHKL